MADKLRIFVSSTVKDFGPVRADLRRWLEGRGMEVRASEADTFPVEHNVTSHEACLRAVAGCHVFILLIGERYGGGYEGTEKSITRRELEEALILKIPAIVLVRDDVNRRAEQWGTKKLRRAPFGKDTVKIVSFIDFVRKGRVDNWFHTWDGSFYSAKQFIQSRMDALFTSYQRPHQDLVRLAQGMTKYATARLLLDQVVVAIGHAGSPRDRVQLFLDEVAKVLPELVGFADGDLWNVAVYVQDAATTDLVVLARVAHPSIPRHDRPWPVGQGHVGRTWHAGTTLIAADLTMTSSWTTPKDTDEVNYRSAVAEPILTADAVTTVRAVLVVTSSRLDHFKSPEQPEVLTVRSLGLMLLQLL